MSVYVIAEAGVNHNGDIEIAKRLVDAAAEAGADAVKFQMFKAKNLASSEATMAEYQKENIGKTDTQQSMLSKLELSEADHLELQKYCKAKGIDFLSSPFDIESMRFLISMGMDIIKIPSGEITNYPYLREAAKSGKRIIMSTGMCTMDEVRAAVDVLTEYSPVDLGVRHGAGSKSEQDASESHSFSPGETDSESESRNQGQLVLLHCNTQYPTPYEDVNLRAMNSLRKEFGCEVGYSDHTLGIEVPIAAVALGATVIEKHFTLDRNMEGPDHKASLEPNELKAMVDAIRHIESALGDGVKRVTDSERANIAVARKSIVAAVPIAKGEVFAEDKLTTMRPGDGISPMRWNEVVGTKAKRDYKRGEKVELGD